MKVVNASGEKQRADFVLNGKSAIAKASDISIVGEGSSMNDVQHPTAIAPSEKNITLKGKTFSQDLEPRSMHVYRLKVR